MTTRFLIIAAVMVVVAIGCIVVPLLRSAGRNGRPRMPFVLALLLVLATPPAVFGAYLLIGTPQALQPAPVDNQADLASAAKQLRASLVTKPDNAQGWALLSQAYSALNEPEQALDALNHLLKLKPNDPDALVAWVEASAESNPAHAIDDAGRAKLKQVLKVDPTHQRALWLLGISDFQRQQYADAVKQWKALLPLLPAGSKVATTVQQELTAAEQASQGTTVAATAPAATSSADATSAVALNITVKLAPKLADKLGPGDVLFVFARAVDGPPMPLAVAKLHPSRIPVSVTLTNAMAMSPGVDLARFPKVEVAARISKSGEAMPQPGDLEAAPVEVATDSHAPIDLTIDKVD
ncbi:MAG TPA: tetratricopeptide repeat protein [Rhodanobacteraceae bacterium]